tara:strand:- start:229 stop:477 length:249 start_codon:yes stop_codon:yes gene_type:complete
MKDLIREYIRFLLEKEVLGEPDQSEEREEDKEEQSVVGGASPAIAGATTPLGTDATYPADLKKKRTKKSTGPKTKKDKKNKK